MYSIGDRVVYGIHGVCRICDTETRTVDKKAVQYFVLEPEEQSGSRFYVPSGNPAALAKLRPLLSKQALLSLLRSPEIRRDCWIEDEGRRKNTYRELIATCDTVALLSVVHTLHMRRKDIAARGRKFHLCDENFLRDAQRVLSAELSAVLEIPVQEIPAYMERVMQDASPEPAK